MADLFRTPQKSQPRPSRSRRKAMTQAKIAQSKQKVAVTTKATRPCIFDQLAALAEETKSKITLAATSEFGSQQFLTPLAAKEYWHVNFAEWNNTMEEGRIDCRIYSADLLSIATDHMGLAVCKYIHVMSTLTDYTDYQLNKFEVITKRLDSCLYNIIKGIPWLVQGWPAIQQYLLTGNLCLMGQAPLEAPSSREVTFEPEPSKTQHE